MNLIPFSPFTEVAKQLDLWGEKGIPFVFLVDYSLEKAWAGSEKDASVLGILFEFDAAGSLSEQVSFQKSPLSFESYAEKFKLVQAGLKRGDSFLLNLTAETPIETSLTLNEIYEKAEAVYKILVSD